MPFFHSLQTVFCATSFWSQILRKTPKSKFVDFWMFSKPPFHTLPDPQTIPMTLVPRSIPRLPSPPVPPPSKTVQKTFSFLPLCVFYFLSLIVSPTIFHLPPDSQAIPASRHSLSPPAPVPPPQRTTVIPITNAFKDCLREFLERSHSIPATPTPWPSGPMVPGIDIVSTRWVGGVDVGKFSQGVSWGGG